MIHYSNFSEEEKENVYDLLVSFVERSGHPKYIEAFNMLTDVRTNEILDWDWAVGMLAQMLQEAR